MEEKLFQKWLDEYIENINTAVMLWGVVGILDQFETWLTDRHNHDFNQKNKDLIHALRKIKTLQGTKDEARHESSQMAAIAQAALESVGIY